MTNFRKRMAQMGRGDQVDPPIRELVIALQFKRSLPLTGVMDKKLELEINQKAMEARKTFYRTQLAGENSNA